MRNLREERGEDCLQKAPSYSHLTTVEKGILDHISSLSNIHETE